MVKYNISSLPFLKQLVYSHDLSSVLEAEQPDVIDCQGIWGYFSKAALDYQIKHPGVKRVITPHGMLDSWALKNSKWKKKLVGWLFENQCLGTADCLHALCKSEYESIRNYGLNNPVAIIPNGINLPDISTIDRAKKRHRVLLFIGRIHPKKGLNELIDAIAILKSKHPELLSDWKVRIAGWNQLNHQEELLYKCNMLDISNYIEFIGPIFGDKKEQELCNADAFILPSFSEGLPMSILEAWAYGLPCVMTDYCNIPEGFEEHAAIRVENNGDSIANGLAILMKMKESDRIEMGIKGYQLCKRKFSWDIVSEQLVSLYTYLNKGGEKPDFVYED